MNAVGSYVCREVGFQAMRTHVHGAGRLFGPVFKLFSIAVIKYPDISDLMEKGSILGHRSKYSPSCQRSQGSRNQGILVTASGVKHRENGCV